MNETKGFKSSYGKFERVIALPVHVQNDQVQAEFKDGVLTLTLPKVTEARNRVVKLNLAGSTDSADQTNDAEATNTSETANA